VKPLNTSGFTSGFTSGPTSLNNPLLCSICRTILDGRIGGFDDTRCMTSDDTKRRRARHVTSDTLGIHCVMMI
jgi:hypothetical protein